MRAELDTMTLPPCPVDDRVVEPLGETDPLIEAACGFRPYAIVVRGEMRALEQLAEAVGAELRTRDGAAAVDALIEAGGSGG